MKDASKSMNLLVSNRENLGDTFLGDMKRDDEADSLWSWLICWTSFTVGFVCFGLLNNYGIFHVEVMQQFLTTNVNSGEKILSKEPERAKNSLCLQFV